MMECCKPENPHRVSRDGFSLVELALAMLVVAIGLITVIGLFVAGLTTNKKAVDDTQMALYAEELLNVIEAEATILPVWNLAEITGKRFTAPAYFMWSPASQSDIEVREGPNLNVNKYIGIGADVEDFAIRCRLTISEPPPIEIDAKIGDRFNIRLEIENGEFGSFSNTTVYVREVYRHDL